MINGKPEGNWIYYFDKVQKYEEGEYKNGEKIGIWNLFTLHPPITAENNHQFLRSTSTWKDGRLVYWKGGNNSLIITSKSGLNKATAEEIFRLDEVIDEFIYQTEPNRTNINWITGESLESILNISLSYFCELLKESKKDVSFIYNIYGKPVREFYYRAGKCEKEIYRDYKGNNLCKYEIYENEVLMQKYVYLNCKPDDINTYLYFPNGQLQMATQIRGNNIKQGKWIEYYKNGNKKQVINYDKGEPTGSWTTYYENGNKKFQESYRMGKLNGKVKKWDIEGNITEIVKYKNGKKVD